MALIPLCQNMIRDCNHSRGAYSRSLYKILSSQHMWVSSVHFDYQKLNNWARIMRNLCLGKACLVLFASLRWQPATLVTLGLLWVLLANIMIRTIRRRQIFSRGKGPPLPVHIMSALCAASPQIAFLRWGTLFPFSCTAWMISNWLDHPTPSTCASSESQDHPACSGCYSEDIWQTI